MSLKLAFAACGLALALFPGRARGQTTLDGSSFALAMARLDASGNRVALDAAALTTFLSAARCACPTGAVVALAIDPDTAATLGSDSVEATLAVGNDCSDVAATDCTTVGTALTLDANQTTSSETVSTTDLFAAAGASASCAALGSKTTHLWAILRQSATAARVPNPPSLALGVGGAAAQPPSGVTVQTANQALVVSWAPSASAVGGYQMLCSPGPAAPSPPAYDTCAAAPPPAGGAGPFATLDPSLICSGLVSGTSVRVSGLDNGRTYQVAVIAVGADGMPSAPSAAAQGAPAPTLGFDDIYRENGGAAQAGCSVAAGGGSLPAGLILLVLVLAARRRRARVIAVALVLAAVPARAADDGFNFGDPSPQAGVESPRHWNLELRFGPYKPAVDSEFADRGSPARPFEETFGSSRRLMAQLELDRHITHRSGTLALGLGAGIYRASAKALAADEQTRTGDDTSLRLVPLSASLVYRADQLRRTRGLPLVPYLKAGLDATIWTMADSAKASSTTGTTFGWHAAGGLALTVDFLDPEAARTLDQEAGVNQTAIFVEVARYALDGLGGGPQLRVGDTTWLAGLMLEL